MLRIWIIPLVLSFSLVAVPVYAYSSLPDWANPIVGSDCEIIGGLQSGEILPNQQIRLTYDLEAGRYTVAGWAEIDFLSLKMEVRGDSGLLLASDYGEDNRPTITLNVNAPTKIDVVLTPGRSINPDSPTPYAVAVAKGRNCFERNEDRMQTMFDEWCGIMLEDGYEIIDWDIIDLTEENPTRFTYTLDRGSYAAVAETSNAMDDIDMYVKVDDATTIGKDEEPNNSPACIFDLDHAFDVMVDIDAWELRHPSETSLVFILAINPD